MGLTETAAPVLSNPLDPVRRKHGSPGRAVGNEAKIVDKTGREAPRGGQGEIIIGGDNVMKRYYKAPDVTTRTLEPDGWFHTGDQGSMDEEGFVFVTGRLKELIIKGGGGRTSRRGRSTRPFINTRPCWRLRRWAFRMGITGRRSWPAWP